MMLVAAPTTPPEFWIKPMVQLGVEAGPAKPSQFTVVWGSSNAKRTWRLRFLQSGFDWRWSETETRTIYVNTNRPFHMHQATVRGLQPGLPTTYEIFVGDRSLFQATTVAPKTEGQSTRFLVFGDCGAGSAPQRALAQLGVRLKPDYAVIPGDIVYDRGRLSEYQTRFFPYFNSDSVPFLRSILTIGVLGNHDVSGANLGIAPDGLAYYYLWSQPRGFPRELKQWATPNLRGPATAVDRFRSSARDRFPDMGAFNFRIGDAHWTVIDSNPYVRWNQPELRQWLDRKLGEGKASRWQFVSFHHPPFHSSINHSGDTWMRTLSPLFEKHKVDIVFSGHVHNYQRTRPIRMTGGKMQIDQAFNGKTATKANGVIYVVTGAGGAGLYDRALESRVSRWKPFTAAYIGRHSLTQVDLNGQNLQVQQRLPSGQVVDRWKLTARR